MKLLLDTHIWLWSLLEPARLGRRVARALEAEDNELWLSPISVWELLILVEKGRVFLKDDVERWIARAMQAASLKEAPVTHEVAIETRRIVLPHRDPADRFIAATARVFDLTLVTADRRLLRLKGISTLPNR
jgi:PIN domain nuclease of toxin-antitoxin system